MLPCSFGRSGPEHSHKSKDLDDWWCEQLRNNALIGNAFVNTPQFVGNYGAEAFAANSDAVATVNNNTATLLFNQLGYDAVPRAVFGRCTKRGSSPG